MTKNNNSKNNKIQMIINLEIYIFNYNYEYFFTSSIIKS